MLLLFMFAQMLAFAQSGTPTTSAHPVCNALQMHHLNLGCCGDQGKTAVCVAPTIPRATRQTQMADYNSLASIRAIIDHSEIKHVTSTYGNNETYHCVASSMWFHSEHITVECHNAYKIIAFRNGTTVEQWTAEDGTVITYTLISAVGQNRRASKGKGGGVHCSSAGRRDAAQMPRIGHDTAICCEFSCGTQGT